MRGEFRNDVVALPCGQTGRQDSLDDDPSPCVLVESAHACVAALDSNLVRKGIAPSNKASAGIATQVVRHTPKPTRVKKCKPSRISPQGKISSMTASMMRAGDNAAAKRAVIGPCARRER